MDFSPADLAAIKREQKKHFGWAIWNWFTGTLFLVALIILPHSNHWVSILGDVLAGICVLICYGKMGFRLAIMGFINALGPRN